MALEIKGMKRVFKMKKNSQEIVTGRSERKHVSG